MRIIRPSKVVFANDKLEKSFYSMKDGDEVKIHIKRAIKDMQENAFSGIQVPKRLIPKEYNVSNLWKYDLPNAWRLIYTITTPNKVEILSVILDFFNHKEYSRIFGYKK